MATTTTTSKATCVLCEKIKVTYICEGCAKRFCIEHLLQHRTNIEQQFDQLQNDHDQLRQQINDLESDPTKHPLIERIEQWEMDSINRIKEQAQLCKTQFIHSSNSFLRNIKEKLNLLAQRIKEIHQENAFNEVDLNHLKKKLELLHEELIQPHNVSIKQQSIPFIDKISLLLSLGKGKNQCKCF